MTGKHRSFPKEGIKKLKQVIRDLKVRISFLERENRFLSNELENLMKPVRERKIQVDKSIEKFDDWKKDFVRRWKRDVLGERDE